MRKFALVGAAMALSLSGPAQAASQSGLDLDGMDRNVRACDDFYRFSCGGWLKANPVPADQATWGVDTAMAERIRARLREILDRAASQPTPDTKKIGDFWSACMDEQAVESKGVAAIQPVLDVVASLNKPEDAPDVVAKLHRLGVSALFGFGSQQDFADATQQIAALDQGGLGLPERDYYLKPDRADLRRDYEAHVARMFELAGASPADARRDAATVLGVETQLAKASMGVVERRDPRKLYHKQNVAALQSKAPKFGWLRYSRAIGAPEIEQLNVVNATYPRAVDALLTDKDLARLRTYLRWQVLHQSADGLPQRFVQETFDFFGKRLNGAKELKPRWKRCVIATDAVLGEDLGRAFVADAFPPAAKAKMQELVKALDAVFAEDIEQVDWMAPATKAKAREKLGTIANKLGYPDKWRDYSKLEIRRDDWMGDLQRGSAFELQRQLNRIGQLVDRGEWDMTPPTVNAYYDPQKNDINFPAGILQPPYFDVGFDDSVNYGATAATVGHEMTHGFDDEGRRFDAKGNLQDWWTKQDGKRFDAKAECVAKQFDGYDAVPGTKLNGHLSLGENVADLGGTRLALLAYLKRAAANKAADMDGFTPTQRFFVAYAQSWCTNQTPESAKRQALTNPHATAEWRVNGVVSNLGEFAQAFQCKPKDKMVRQTQCRVW
ncbi:MAG: Endothelin-converting enzyme 1 [Rhodospirillales bacterium]|nr:Endothelin-converting enzyme 1 [Rhodospirillales bacterium]